LPPPQKPKRRLVRTIQIGAAVVTFVATVVGLAIAIESRPKPANLAGWSTKANAACEKYFGDVLQPVLTVMPQLAQELAGMQTGTGNADPDRIKQISQQLAGIAGAFRKLVGELDGIEAPKGNAKIADLLKTGRDVSTEFGTVASMLTGFAMNQMTPEEITAGGQALQHMSGTSMPAWSRLSADLKIDQCELFGVPASDGPSAPATGFSPAPGPSTPGAAQLTRAEQNLVAQIKTSILAQCVPAPKSETGDVVAAVNCRAAQQGPTKLPLVMQFSSATAMNRWITGWAADITPKAGNRCPDGQYNVPWTSSVTDNQRAGQLVCKQVATGDFSMVWSFDSTPVVVFTDGADGPSLYQWWTANAYLITSP
jgi:hypothetical protein